MTAEDAFAWMWRRARASIERAEPMEFQVFRPKGSAVWEPPVDIFEGEGELLIVAVLPGVEAADIEVYLQGNELVFSGLRRMPSVARGASIRRLEVPYGRFERRLVLPQGSFQVNRSELLSGCLFLSLRRAA